MFILSYSRVDLHGKLYMNELVTMFLQYHAYIRLCTGNPLARILTCLTWHWLHRDSSDVSVEFLVCQ